MSNGSTTSAVTPQLEGRGDGDDAVRQCWMAMRFPMRTIALRRRNRPTRAFWRFAKAGPHWPH